MSELSNISEYFTPDLVARFAEVNQPRSEFQLEKFVVEQHDTPEMQYVQIINELQNLYYTIKTVGIEIKKKEIEIERLKNTGDEIDALDAELKEIGLEQTRVVSVGAFRELEILLKMLEKYPRYTREQIEEAQPDYWAKRIFRQLEVDRTGAGASHIQSLIQMGAINFEYPKEALDYKNVKQITKGGE